MRFQLYISKIYNKTSQLFNLLVSPKSSNFDQARREFVLNVVLIGVIVATIIALLRDVSDFVKNNQVNGAISPYSFGCFLLFLLFLYKMSRSGYSKYVAYSLIILPIIIPIYTLYFWGIGVPTSLLAFALLIVMSGILVNSRFSFIIAGIISFIGILLTYLQTQHILNPDYSWRTRQVETLGDAYMYISILGLIAVISWLFNRQSENAFKRASQMELSLIRERDLLEIKVEERTRKIKQVQMEGLAGTYRMAEIGRMTSGFFHDLVTPLNLVLLNLDRLSTESQHNHTLSVKDNRELIDRAIRGTKHLEKFITAARRQVGQRDVQVIFNVNDEINDAITILNHKIKEAGAEIIYKSTKPIMLYGNPLRFNQVVINLISNAIDAYIGIKRTAKLFLVKVTLIQKGKQLVFSVSDKGIGISPEIIAKIYDPFFTTKAHGKGIGLGLMICKDVVEKEFNGNIQVKSKLGVGTTFKVILPVFKTNNQSI
jgi:signal transduction histidine kinase